MGAHARLSGLVAEDVSLCCGSSEKVYVGLLAALVVVIGVVCVMRLGNVS